MRTLTLLHTLLFVALATPASAQGHNDTAAEILKRVDQVATQANDFTAKVELVTVDANRKKTKRTFVVWQKGQQQRMLKVTSPARLEGVGMLATSPDELWMYLPSFGRTRRVAGRKRGQPFLGSNFTQDDVVRTAWAPRFTPSLKSQDDETWTLRLEPKNPKSEPHHHLILTVRKKDAVVSRVDFHDDANKPTRRLELSDVKKVGETTLAHRLTMIDLSDDSRSTAVLSDVKVDNGLEDALFSKRNLKRKPR